MEPKEMNENHIEADISNFMIKEEVVEKKRERHFILETILNACIEISSMADFISDLIILQALAVFFFLYQAWSGGDRAQEKLKEYVIGQGQAAASKALSASSGKGSLQDQMMQMTLN